MFIWSFSREAKAKAFHVTPTQTRASASDSEDEDLDWLLHLATAGAWIRINPKKLSCRSRRPQPLYIDIAV